MAFITKDDIIKALHGEYLEEITRGDDLIVDANIDAAIEEMGGYLSGIYDIDVVFAQTGANRNSLLVQFGADIAIFNIVEVDRPGIDMEDRTLRYKRAIAWLKEVMKGNINAKLPKLEEDEDKQEKVIFGSRPKRNNHY